MVGILHHGEGPLFLLNLQIRGFTKKKDPDGITVVFLVLVQNVLK